MKRWRYSRWDGSQRPFSLDADGALDALSDLLMQGLSAEEALEWMQRAGFEVEVRDTDNLHPVKARLGVPYGKGSCHTAEVDGYLIEGHVPADDIRRLLAERPKARGLVLPGMPLGSPGMETPDGRVQPYTVELVAQDGSTSAFRQHGSP